MKTPHFFGFTLTLSIAAIAIGVAAFSATGFAQELAGQDEESALNEQTIYIPYEKLRETFERDGRGVFLPYEKFQQLWREARANQPKTGESSAPLGALITDIESVATLGKEIVSVDATIQIELLEEGWHRVPLRLNGAAIRSATIGDQAARIVSADDGSYELLVAHEGPEPATMELNLSYAKSLSKSGGQSNVAFQSPQAPVNRWAIRTGQRDIDVQIEPMIASTKKTADDEPENETDIDGGDEILAFVGAAPTVKIIWTPKSEGASGLAALVSVETYSRFQIAAGVARTSATMALDISRAKISSVSFEVPADQKVVNVFDRNVKKWDVENTDAGQTVTVELFEPALGRQSLAIELEQFIEAIEDREISVPQIKAKNVSRNSGIVVVNMSGDLRAEPAEKTGLLQMDVGELPAVLRNQKWDFAYRYASLPFALKLNIKKIQPLINVDQLLEVVLSPEKMHLELSSLYDIQLAGVFQVNLDIPVEFEIREIRPLARQGLESVPVEAFYRDSEDKDRVIVTLGRKAIGKFGLHVSLTRDLNDANLLHPSDTASEVQFDIPKAQLDGIEFSQGHVVVYAPESLQVNAAETKGLRTESFTNAFLRLSSAINANGSRPLLAFSFSHTDASLDLQAKRRRPQVVVQQVVIISVQSGVIKYDARLFYEVRYSGVRSLRLDVPTELVGELRNRSNNIVQQDLIPAPEDLADGYTAWTLTSDNEFFGQHEIRFTWEEKIADLPLGEGIVVNVDRLIPANIDRSTGQIVLTKSETIEVRPGAEASGLRPIDPQTDLSNGVTVSNAAMAFEFVDDWNLNLSATRFELQELKRTSISRAVIRAVALRQNELSVQCLYQMRSVGQRVSLQMPVGFDAATSFDDSPIRVNGRRVSPERGGKDVIYVPLTGQNLDQSFLLEVRYTIPGSSQQIDLPVFIDDPAVQKVYLCVYLPHEKALLHQSGPWTDEAFDEHNVSIAGLMNAHHENSLTNRMFRRRNENVDQLLSWVMEGVNCDSSANQKFEVDGRPYVFSALRPDPAPAGSIQLRTFNMTLLNVFVCGGLVLLGLLFLRSRLATQLAAALVTLAALLFTGVFFPLVTEHLFSESFLLTAVFVGVAWLLFDLMRWFRSLRRERAEFQTPESRPANLAINEGGSIPASEIEAVNDSPPPTNDSEGGAQ
jgi:hypothetical protein